MERPAHHQKLEVGAYIVTLALAIPSFIFAKILNPSPFQDFLINLSATFAGAGFLFFLLNRFFGIETGTFLGNDGPISATKFFKHDFDDLRDRLGNAESIDINGITLARTSNTYINEFNKCLAHGGSVRILIVDPKHPVLEAVANRFNKHQDANKIRREIEQSLDNLETLFSSGRKNKSFQIRLSDAVPPFGIWLIDAGNKNAEIWAEIYSFRGNRDPALHLLPNRDGEWFNFFQEQYEILWNNSTEWRP